MNKKAWYTFRIVLGGYLAWLGIRMLIEMVNEKPNNMVFMCVMSVIFILIGLAYAIYYVKKMFDLKKEDHRIAEGETEKSGYKAGSETEQSDDKVKKEAEKPNDKNEEDAEDEMIKEGGKNQEPELAMEEFIEETETEIENDYEER